MGKVLKIYSEFDQVKATILDGFLSIRQGNDLIAMSKDEAIKLAEWILENMKNADSDN